MESRSLRSMTWHAAWGWARKDVKVKIMTRKQRRAVLILACVGLLGLSSLLVLFALRDSIVFFHTPSDIAEKGITTGQRFRLGGLVAEGSVRRGQGSSVEFSVTDTIKTISVTFNGVLPDLFREGQGVVTEGQLDGSGKFHADTVLAKHDETYMPPEVAGALKEKGVWQDFKAKQPATN